MKLRKTHRSSAMFLSVFLLVHLSNHLFALAGVQAHLQFMDAVRPYYRNLLVEGLLILCAATQILSGLNLFCRGFKARKDFVAWLQAITGVYLAFFLSLHVLAVLAARHLANLDTNFYFAAAGLHVAPFQYFFLPYYFLSIICLLTHLGCAAFWRVSMQNQVIALRLLIAAALVGLIFASLIVAGLSGCFEVIHIPAQYQKTFE